MALFVKAPSIYINSHEHLRILHLKFMTQNLEASSPLVWRCRPWSHTSQTHLCTPHCTRTYRLPKYGLGGQRILATREVTRLPRSSFFRPGLGGPALDTPGFAHQIAANTPETPPAPSGPRYANSRLLSRTKRAPSRSRSRWAPVCRRQSCRSQCSRPSQHPRQTCLQGEETQSYYNMIPDGPSNILADNILKWCSGCSPYITIMETIHSEKFFLATSLSWTIGRWEKHVIIKGHLDSWELIE